MTGTFCAHPVRGRVGTGWGLVRPEWASVNSGRVAKVTAGNLQLRTTFEPGVFPGTSVETQSVDVTPAHYLAAQRDVYYICPGLRRPYGAGRITPTIPPG
uniref:Uncharacterized protein MLCB637.19 n=1 Tax=Mycobacterium leprae TaxID=1769 RepID=O33111_MYCLR|nr:hypothetical protein MLCB637.19 [Mycobacterium leprae]